MEEVVNGFCHRNNYPICVGPRSPSFGVDIMDHKAHKVRDYPAYRPARIVVLYGCSVHRASAHKDIINNFSSCFCIRQSVHIAQCKLYGVIVDKADHPCRLSAFLVSKNPFSCLKVVSVFRSAHRLPPFLRAILFPAAILSPVISMYRAFCRDISSRLAALAL